MDSVGTITINASNERLESLINDLLLEQKRTNQLLSKMAENPQKEVLGHEEAAALLNISPRTLYDMCSERRITRHKSGGKNVYYRHELMQYLNGKDADSR